MSANPSNDRRNGGRINKKSSRLRSSQSERRAPATPLRPMKARAVVKVYPPFPDSLNTMIDLRNWGAAILRIQGDQPIDGVPMISLPKDLRVSDAPGIPRAFYLVRPRSQSQSADKQEVLTTFVAPEMFAQRPRYLVFFTAKGSIRGSDRLTTVVEARSHREEHSGEASREFFFIDLDAHHHEQMFTVDTPLRIRCRETGIVSDLMYRVNRLPTPQGDWKVDFSVRRVSA